MRKLIAAIACRNAGSRLYGKPLQNLDIKNGYTILDNIVSCLSRENCIQDIVLGIAEGNDNLSYVKFSELNKIPYIIGDEIDVLGRLIRCGEHANATDVFRVTSESPFPLFELIEGGWNHHIESGADATFLDGVIDGCGFEIIRLSALMRSHELGMRRHRSENCTLYIRENKSDFSIEWILPPPKLIRKNIRLTVDYPEDLIVCRAVYSGFSSRSPRIPLGEVVDFLEGREDLIRLIAPFCEVGYETMYL